MHALLVEPLIAWCQAVVRTWDRFWFAPQQPHTLALIRILGGAMLLYTHLIWSLDLVDFLGPEGWLPTSTVVLLNQAPDGKTYAWSYLYYVDSPALLWTLHLAALAVFALLTVGYQTRIMSVLSFVITISYCHRLTGSLFGLDQINALIATYLMVGPSGAVYSVDRWLKSRSDATHAPTPTVSANIAIRLIQIHMCVIYLFGGIGKARGELWWDGSALWYAFANLEYQSLDMTWMVRWPALIALLTHATVFWEVFYAFLIWPKLTRPIMLILAVFVHAGIAIALGMKTFGLVMLIGNLAFIYPEYIQEVIATFARRLRRDTAAAHSSPPAVKNRSNEPARAVSASGHTSSSSSTG